jgi:hypothetical protein
MVGDLVELALSQRECAVEPGVARSAVVKYSVAATR